jgi:hypothetical protein
MQNILAGRAPADHLKNISELIEPQQLRPVTGVLFSPGLAQEARALSQSVHGCGRILLQIH